jgi:hypothetical protein
MRLRVLWIPAVASDSANVLLCCVYKAHRPFRNEGYVLTNRLLPRRLDVKHEAMLYLLCFSLRFQLKPHAQSIDWETLNHMSITPHSSSVLRLRRHACIVTVTAPPLSGGTNSRVAFPFFQVTCSPLVTKGVVRRSA